MTVVILALLYLRFGRGSGAAGSTATGPHRCAIRISPAGITVDGQSVTRDQAVAACVAAGNGADVTVTGDTREGDWQDLLAALMAAGVPVGIHQ